MNRKKLLFVTLMVFFVFSGCSKGSQTESEGEMRNQITSMIDNDGADPWVLKQGNQYYYTKTTGNNITLFCSEWLSNIGAGEQKIVWEENSEIASFWAPELHYLDNKWYIYFAASYKGNEIHQMFVLINENENPLEGVWECKRVEGMDDKFAIDGTILDTENGRYFIWSGWEGYENVQQNLYIAQMISPTEIKKEKILLSKPEYKWEQNGTPLINEGPQVVIRKNTINLVYSASGSWTNDYCLGLLTAPIDAIPTNPSIWKKEKEPVFESANGIYGPGHNSFTLSPDGLEEFMVYHAARWDGSGWNRSIRMQKIEFDQNGKLLSGKPVDSQSLIDIPKGEPSRLVYSGDCFNLTKGLELVSDEDSVSKTAVRGFQETEERLSLDINVPEEGNYTICFFAKLENCYDEKNIVPFAIEINEESIEKCLYPSEYYQVISVQCKLNNKKNTIQVGSIIGGDEISIDRIEIIPFK